MDSVVARVVRAIRAVGAHVVQAAPVRAIRDAPARAVRAAQDRGAAPPRGAAPAGAATRAGLLLAVPGVAAWATGAPAVFPSLGPSAYLLATRDDRTVAPRRVVGGHAVGVVAGLAAHGVLAPGLALGATEPLAAAWLGLSASAVASVALTAGGMAAAGVEHSPACATTLIVSLGILPTVVDGAVIVASVLVLVAADAALPAAGDG